MTAAPGAGSVYRDPAVPEYHFSNLVMDFSRLLEILKENDLFLIKKMMNMLDVICRQNFLSKMNWRGDNISILLYIKKSFIWFIKLKSFIFNINYGEKGSMDLQSRVRKLR